MNPVSYRLIRSGRRTVSLEITRDLEILVRAPQRMPRAQIDSFVESRRSWLETHMTLARERAARMPPAPTEEERQNCIRQAKELIPRRVEHYGRIMGLIPAGVTITGAEKRFGSCSGKNSEIPSRSFG